jgi:hypothetical protein
VCRVAAPDAGSSGLPLTIQLLIDAIFRQTTVLIAQLATSGGVRAPLAHVADQVFLALAAELEAQGVSRKVSADMFGMALRAYIRKVQRLGESSTERGRSLWEAVYDYLGANGVVTREKVIERFHRDEDALVRGVLHDLAESGLVFATGAGARTVYRVATEDELGRMRQFTQGRIDELLWVIIYREGPVTRAQLCKLAGTKSAHVEEALGRLVEAGRVEQSGEPAEPSYRASSVVIPIGAEAGWEAALLDHFHALVRTICQKLRLTPESAAGDTVGGSTYTFAVWPGHPLRDEVVSGLQRIREQFTELRTRVDVQNVARGVPDDYEQVVFYCGQSVTKQGSEDDDASEA